MSEGMKVLFVGTALTVSLSVIGTWGGWVTTTLMSVDKRTEVMTQKMDDTHTMLASIISKMSPQTISAKVAPDFETETKASLGN
jgi:hypothetical protein